MNQLFLGPLLALGAALSLPLAAQEQIETAEQQLFNLATTGDQDGQLKPLRLAINAAIDELQSAKRELHLAESRARTKDGDPSGSTKAAAVDKPGGIIQTAAASTASGAEPNHR